MRVKDQSKEKAIFKATLKLVKQKGLAGITMCDISKEAAIATGTLYIYFKNKEELIKALFEASRKHSADHYFEGVDPEDDFKDRMHKVFTNIIHYKVDHFDVSAFLEQLYHSSFVCMTDFKKKEKAIKPLYDLLSEGFDQKKLKPSDPEVIITFLFGIINEVVKKNHFAKMKLSEPVIEELFLLFWSGVKSET